MHLIDVEDLPKNQHRFFVDDHDQGRKFDPVEQFNTHESLLNRKSNRLTKEQLEKLEMPSWVDDDFIKQMSKTRAKKYKELVERVKRSESLNKLEQTYDLKQVLFFFCILNVYFFIFYQQKNRCKSIQKKSMMNVIRKIIRVKTIMKMLKQNIQKLLHENAN